MNSQIPYFSVVFARDVNSGGFASPQKQNIGHFLKLQNYFKTQNNLKNGLPWKLNDDLQHFKRITTQGEKSVVIMGKYTYESLPYKKLSGREIIVVTKTYIKNVNIAFDLNKALILAGEITNNKSNSIFIIGGISLLNESFLHPKLEKIYETTVDCHKKVNYSLYFKKHIPVNFIKTSSIQNKKDDNNEYDFCWNEYNIDTDEYEYLNLLKNVLTNSDLSHIREDRTKVGTLSVFSPNNLTFNLKLGFPLLTTKKVNFKAVAYELLWILKGKTHVNYLQQNNVKIWDGNSSREFLDKSSLQHFETGELGKVYGFQLRNWNGHFEQNSESHIGKGGYDQIEYVLNLLRTDQFSRRILINLWNPADFKESALPPCHYSCQFYVHAENDKKYLSCKLILRSSDLLLGLPYNISSYSLLTHMIAKTVNMEVDKLVISIGDAHIYYNHISQIKTQLTRACRKFPTLKILNKHEKLEDYDIEDFLIENYNPHSFISAPMAV